MHECVRNLLFVSHASLHNIYQHGTCFLVVFNLLYMICNDASLVCDAHYILKYELFLGTNAFFKPWNFSLFEPCVFDQTHILFI